MEHTDVAVDNLTQAEKDLIIAERNRKAAEEAEKLAKQNLEKAGKIAAMKKTAAEFVTKNAQLKIAYEKVANELNYDLPNGFKLIATPHQNKLEATNGTWRSEDRVVYDTMTVDYETFEIHSKRQLEDSRYSKVYVTVQFDNGAYRMSIHGIQDSDRHYKRTSKVVEKITSFFAAHDNAIIRKQKATTLAGRALEAVKAKHPEATVSAEHVDHYREGRRYGRREHYATTNYILAKFPNDAQISYTYSEVNDEVKLTIYTYSLQSIDQNAIINFLITAPKKSTM